ncbi:hypothetical protein TSAR_002645 [Trichomalopsis sarcophagae]|uniref:Uncharacterized protein n=1 Tax=Trichomalopsis sarcophagae TaxID=543379 RepID=A0A232ENW0_9HYME|nr:hypothetical protein TSAR_002645 [Trichomalopsis sarcophagae]
MTHEMNTEYTCNNELVNLANVHQGAEKNGLLGTLAYLQNIESTSPPYMALLINPRSSNNSDSTGIVFQEKSRR